MSSQQSHEICFYCEQEKHGGRCDSDALRGRIASLAQMERAARARVHASAGALQELDSIVLESRKEILLLRARAENGIQLRRDLYQIAILKGIVSKDGFAGMHDAPHGLAAEVVQFVETFLEEADAEWAKADKAKEGNEP